MQKLKRDAGIACTADEILITSGSLQALDLVNGVLLTRGDTVIAAQFCEWDKPDHRNAPRVVRSLAFQLATRLPDYRKLLLTLPEIAELDRKQTAAELFDYLLANPLRSVKGWDEPEM